MKNKNKHPKSEFFEVIVPLNAEGAEELFDDCPLCQELKAKVLSGEVELLPIQVHGEDVN